jgi:hypothetical protein
MGKFTTLLGRRYLSIILILISCLSISSPVLSHHAFAGVFDMSTQSEVEGEITNVIWRNPHVRFSLLATDGVSWDIQTNSVSILRRMDITTDFVSVGDIVRFAGYEALDGGNAMWVNNMLLSDGREVVLRPGVPRVWTGEKIGSEELWLTGGSAIEESGAGAASIFRVWSTHFTGVDRQLWDEGYQLTEAAAAAQAKYNMLTDNPIANCEPKGMPWIMAQPYPVGFVEDGENILFQIEEYDTVRTIYMNSQKPADVESSRLGYSTGRWDGAILVVETSDINYPVFNDSGIPQSEEIHLVERFIPSADGRRLDYTLVVDDAANFIGSATFDKAWIWHPGEQVRPYECTNG